MARTSNELTKIMLVACDMSYAADDPRIGFVGSPLQEYRDTPNYDIPIPFSIPSGYVIDQLFDDQNTTNTGFKAIALRGQNDVIIAFAGTENLQDWKEDLKFGWNQWTNNKASVFSYLDGLRASDGVSPFTGKIHFTGQSLGGGLAEYAAYEFLARASTQAKIDALKIRITVTTFNGFGGAAILTQERSDFRPDMLADLSESSAYYIANDVISRLGISHVGIQEYLLDYRAQNVNPESGLKYFLDPFDAHRIEPGFYRNYNPVVGFDESVNLRSSKIVVPALQQAAALWAGIFSERTSAPGDAKWRLPAGIVGGALIAPTEEMREFSREVVAAFDRAGAFSPFPHPNESLGEYARRKVLSLIGLSAADMLVDISKPSFYKAIAGLFAVALGADVNGKRAIADGFRQVLGSEVELSSVSDSELLLQSRMALAAIPGVVDEEVDVSKVFFGLNLDLATYADMVFADRTDWLDETLKRLLDVGFRSHSTASARINFEAALVDLVQQEKSLLAVSGDAVLQDKVATALRDFQERFAQALANTNSNFSDKYILASASPFGATQLDFVAYDGYHDALEQAATDSEFFGIESLLEDTLEVVESAGQMIDLETKLPAANPFDAAEFDPDAAPLPQAQVREGGVQRFTLSLPYGAAEDGQRIAITLDGTAATNARLLAHGEEVLCHDGIYTVTVASGERELELSLVGTLGITQPGLTEPGALSLSATLVDSAGQATHQTHVEANVDFAPREDLVPEEPFSSPLTEGNDTWLIQTPLSGANLDGVGGNDVIWGDSGTDRFLGGPDDDRLFGSFRLYVGANDSDWLSGGTGNDQLLGHEGDDLLEGDFGRDAVLGDVGNDVLFAGSQADYATIFTLGGEDPSSDLVQGGAGDDLVVGSAGADALSGGNDADLIFGGAGNDEIRGDTEFVPTHTFHIIGTTFPPEQPFAGGADVLYGNAGDDILLGEAGDDRLYGGEGFDRLIGGAGRDELYGGDGDDFLVGDADSLDPVEHADDYLHGGEASDILLGHDGNDTLVGDGGDDFLEGGDGIDTYVFNRGDGADTIFDFGSNTVRFGPGIDADDLKLGLGSLFIHVGEEGDAIRIMNFDPDDVLGSFGVDLFEFLNGEQLTYAQLVSPGFDLEGTAEDDFIKGTNLTDRITGGEGNDLLDGAGGADVLRGGRGDDMYRVDEPDDVIEEAFDEGHDNVQSTAVSYVLSSNLETLELIEQRTVGDGESEEEGGGQVVITGGITGTGNDLDNDIAGNSLNNVLDGRGGNDRLIGESGSDTYLFSRGSGTDTIAEFIDAPGDVDTIQLGSNVVPAEVAVIREENDLILAIRNSPDRMRIQDWFASDTAKVELALFEDGTAWDSAMLEAMAATGGTNNAPVLVTGISDQFALEDAVFTFVVLSDTFEDADTGDTLTFDAMLEGGAPLPSWLSFEPATQTFSGTPANDDVGIFDVTVTATDSGGLSAADVFGVTVENTNDPPVLALEVADQSTLEDIPFSFTLLPDTFLDVDAGDVLTLSAALAGDAPLPGWLTFDPDTRTLSGTPANEDVGVLSVAITATDSAGASATANFGLTVENVNDAPALAKPLSDQSGNQNAPFSFQIPEEAFLDVDAGDALAFTAALTDGSPLPEWLEFDGATGIFSGTPSEFDIGGSDIRVTATDNAGVSAFDDFALFISDASAVNETHAGTRHRDVIVTGFANDLIDADRGDDVVHAGAGRDTVSGGRGHDHLSGESGNDVLAGGEGHDHLLGGLGEDLLAGGDGHDRLEGGEGHDAYLHERHGGHDTIEEQGSGFDVLLLGVGITPEMARLERRRDDLVVDLHGDHGSVTIKGWFASDSNKVETIQFADGTAWGVEAILERAMRTRHQDSGHHDDDHEHHHPHSDDDDDRQRKSDGRANDGGSRDRTEDQRDRVADFLAAYLADEAQYAFEALAMDTEPSDWRGEVLSPQEIAHRWNRIARYAAWLSDEQDDDATKGAAYRLDGGGLLGGALGGSFGYAGSTGATRGAGNMRTLEGLKEGFHQLHD